MKILHIEANQADDIVVVWCIISMLQFYSESEEPCFVEAEVGVTTAVAELLDFFSFLLFLKL